MAAAQTQTPLRKALHESGKTQRQIAAEVGVNEAVISRYVHGLEVPDERRGAVAAALGREVSDIWPPAEVRAA